MKQLSLLAKISSPSLVGMHATRYSRQLSLSAFCIITGCAARYSILPRHHGFSVSCIAVLLQSECTQLSYSVTPLVRGYSMSPAFLLLQYYDFHSLHSSYKNARVYAEGLHFSAFHFVQH